MTIPYQNTKDINQFIHESSEALHLSEYAVTPVNGNWVITYAWKNINQYRYLAHYPTQQIAVDRVLFELGIGETTRHK